MKSVLMFTVCLIIIIMSGTYITYRLTMDMEIPTVEGQWFVNCQIYHDRYYQQTSTKYPVFQEGGRILIVYPEGATPDILYNINNCLIRQISEEPAPPSLLYIPTPPKSRTNDV